MFDRFREWIEDWLIDRRLRRNPYPPGPPYEGNVEFSGPGTHGCGFVIGGGMKIYAVTFGAYDDEHIVGHYSSQQLAFEAMKRMNVTVDHDASVSEYTLDDDSAPCRWIPYSEYLAWMGSVDEPLKAAPPDDVNARDGVAFGNMPTYEQTLEFDRYWHWRAQP